MLTPSSRRLGSLPCATLVAFAFTSFLGFATGQTPRLESPLPFEVGFSPRSLACDDFNADGHLDMAVAGDGSYAVRTGDGRGGFEAPLVGANDVSFPSHMHAARVDGDAHVDLVIASLDDSVRVLYGRGDGTFEPEVVLTQSADALFVLSGDLDEDGLEDLLCAGHQTFFLYMADGPRSFAPPVEFTPGVWGLRQMVLADFDGDDHLDVAATVSNTDDLVVYFGDGTGTLSNEVRIAVGNHPESIAVDDFDLDGHLDIAVGMLDSTLSIVLGDGARGFELDATLDLGIPLWRLASEDWSGDGVPDLVASTWGLALLRGSGDGSFSVEEIRVTGRFARPFCIGDFDEDGVRDILVAGEDTFTVNGQTLEGRPYLLLGNGRAGNGRGRFEAAQTLVVGDPVEVPEADAVLIHDFTGDGRPDLLTASAQTGTLEVLEQDASGRFSRSGSIASPGDPWYVVPGDFDLDGRLDFAVSELAAGTVRIYKTQASGDIVESDAFDDFFEPRWMSRASLDDRNDSIDDLAVIEENGRSVRVLRGNGVGGFQVGVRTDILFDDTRSMAVADFDEDGHLDFVTSFGIARFGDGFATFPGLNDLGIRGAWNDGGDLDEDGHVDLVFGFEDGRVEPWFGDGAGGFVLGAPLEGPTGPGGTRIAIADMNDDGHLDILALYETVWIYEGDGTGSFTFASKAPVQVGAGYPTVADIDADGRPDLVAPTRTYGISVLRNRTGYFDCRLGTVNDGAGATTDVLFVNGSAGHGDLRKVVVDASGPLEISMDAAPADAQSKYALYAWLDAPDNLTVNALPFSVGTMCRMTPLGDPRRLKKIWNNTGKTALGESDFPAPLAPAIVFERNPLGIPATFFLQAIITDSGSASPKNASATNGVAVVSH